MKNILVSYPMGEASRKLLEDRTADLATVYYLKEMSEKRQREVLPNIHIVLCNGWKADISDEVFGLMERLEVVQALPAGVDYLPFEKFTGKPITVYSNAGAYSVQTAELAFALLLAAAKNIIMHDDRMRRGVFDQTEEGKVLDGSLIGIIGFGGIGKELSRMARAFGMRTYAINTTGKSDAPFDFLGTLENLGHVLEVSDIVVLSVPFTVKTRHLIKKEQLEQMKRDAVLVNVARGHVVKQDDLYTHLKANPQFKYASDVWWRYPANPGDPVVWEYPFNELDNFIATPHIGGHVPGSEEKVAPHAIENIVRILTGQKPHNIERKGEYVGLREDEKRNF